MTTDRVSRLQTPRRLVLRFEGTVEELRDWLVQLADDVEQRRWELTGTKVDQSGVSCRRCIGWCSCR